MDMTAKWDANAVSNLTGKVAIVTGANSGVGLEAARVLARQGAEVWLAARNQNNNQRAYAQILAETPAAQLRVHQLDLGNLASVQSFAEDFLATGRPLDILLNNAGVMALPNARTADGFEIHMGINHFGHFALTGRLLPALLAAPAARVVTVSSNMHTGGTVDFDNLNWENGAYDKWAAYQRSKLANLLFAFELQRRFARAGARAISLGAHPGFSATNLQLLPADGTPALERFLLKASQIMAQSQAMGALPLLYAATAPGLQGGEYIGPGGWRNMRGYPEVSRAADRAYNEADAVRLWEESERLTGVFYEALRMLTT
jgi:NAD(P)-dependent dehydrogenase (short-subunit alcohol dehydrogenase family)